MFPLPCSLIGVACEKSWGRIGPLYLAGSNAVWFNQPFLAIPCLLGVLLFALQPNSASSTVLNWAPIIFLGEISYSIYLVHWTILQIENWSVTRWGLQSDQLFLSALVATAIIPISYLTYRVIEKPARELGRAAGVKRAVIAANADAI